LDFSGFFIFNVQLLKGLLQKMLNYRHGTVNEKHWGFKPKHWGFSLQYTTGSPNTQDWQLSSRRWT